MILSTKDTTPKIGQRMVVKRFAWWPKWVGDKEIWMQSYWEIYIYRTRERLLPYFRGMSRPHYHTWDDWDLVDLKIDEPGF